MGLRVLALPALAVLTLFFSSQAAFAAQAPVTLDQHWELLAENINGLTIGTTTQCCPIVRGVLPGGTTKFDPAPTASLVVVGKVTGGSGNTSWNVHLVSPNSDDLAEVTFSPADSSFTLRSGAIDWPATDMGLDHLLVQGIGATAGSLSIQKAYIDIQQTGIVKKTTGRVPMATKQTQIVTTTWTDVADPYIYRHTAADFDPAPTVTLRVTGDAATGEISNCVLNVRVLDMTAGTSPASMSFDTVTPTSKIAGFSPVDTHQYKLQAALSTSCLNQGNGPQGEGPSSPSASPSGDLINADLVFAQSTTDAAGLVKTVGFYPSVTAATDIAQNNLNLGYLLATPTNKVPNPIVGEWETTVKSTTGSVAADLINVGTSTAVASGGSVTGGTYTTVPHKVGTSIALPATAGTLDTKTNLGTGAAGRIAASVLREVLSLRDTAGPTLAGFTQTIANVATENVGAPVKAISPNGDLKQDTVTFSATLQDFSPSTWTINVLPAGCNDSSCAVRTATGTTTPPADPATPVSVSWLWDGRTSAGTIVDGTYTIRLSAIDSASNASGAIADLSTVVDTVTPTISNFTASNARISPSAGPPSSATYTASLSEVSSYKLSIRDGAGTLVRTSITATGSAVNQVWDGRWGSGTIVAEGSYAATLDATDYAANAASLVGPSVAVDVSGPTITAPLYDAYLSPNADGIKDTSHYTASISDAWTPLSWTLTVKQGPTIIRTFTGTTSGIDVTWDGRNNAGTQVADGAYSYVLQALDAGSNPTTAFGALTLDTAAPIISGWKPDALANTLWRQPTIEATASAGSGSPVDYASRSLTLDDAALASSWVAPNRVVATPSAPLAADTDHRVVLQIDDLAGNRASASSRFRVVGLAQQTVATSISGVDAQTPSNCYVNCTVTFYNVKTTLGLHSATLTSALHPGSGWVRRPLNLSSAQVTWHLPGGLTTTSPAGLSTVTSDDLLEVAQATDQPITLAIPGRDYALAPVTVPVPPGIPPGTTATLAMAPVGQAPGCTDSLQASDPSVCGGPVFSWIDPLNLNVPALYLTHAPVASATAGQDVILPVVVHSRCATSCGTINVTAHYNSLHGVVDLPTQTISSVQAQTLTFTIPGSDVFWWNTATRSPYVFGYWFTMSQSQGGPNVTWRAPSSGSFEVPVDLTLNTTFRYPDGSPLNHGTVFWSFDVADEGLQQSHTQFTGSDGSVQITMPHPQDDATLSDRAANDHYVNVRITAYDYWPQSQAPGAVETRDVYVKSIIGTINLGTQSLRALGTLPATQTAVLAQHPVTFKGETTANASGTATEQCVDHSYWVIWTSKTCTKQLAQWTEDLVVAKNLGADQAWSTRLSFNKSQSVTMSTAINYGGDWEEVSNETATTKGNDAGFTATNATATQQTGSANNALSTPYQWEQVQISQYGWTSSSTYKEAKPYLWIGGLTPYAFTGLHGGAQDIGPDNTGCNTAPIDGDSYSITSDSLREMHEVRYGSTVHPLDIVLHYHIHHGDERIDASATRYDWHFTPPVGKFGILYVPGTWKFNDDGVWKQYCPTDFPLDAWTDTDNHVKGPYLDITPPGADPP